MAIHPGVGCVPPSDSFSGLALLLVERDDKFPIWRVLFHLEGMETVHGYGFFLTTRGTVNGFFPTTRGTVYGTGPSIQ